MVTPAESLRIRPIEQPPVSARSGLRVVRGLVFAVLVAAAVTVGRATGVLDGAVGLLAGVLLVLLVPTSRDLCRRILLAGCLLIGWIPLLWWWPLPVGGLGRVTIGMALLAGALAGWVGSSARPGQRASMLAPRLRVVDLLLPAVVGVGVVALRQWLKVKTPTQTLGMLIDGWDHSAHFSMVHMIRRLGVTVDTLAPPPTGGSWQFHSYPQGFHTVAATLIEARMGPVARDIASELIAYTQAMALMLIGATVLITAGFCALPALRSRPGLATPVAAFVATVYFFGPGSNAIQWGMSNFTIAWTLVVAIALVAITMPRVIAPVPLAAIGGAVVGIASSWALLLALALPAVLIILLPFSRRRWSAPPAHAVAAILTLVPVICCLARTALVISRVQAESPLTLAGGSPPLNFGLLLVATAGALGACLLVTRSSAGSRAVSARIAGLVAVPLAAVAVSVALIFVQLGATGTVTYYGLKFMLGAELVLLLLLVIPTVHLLGRRPRPSTRSSFRSSARGAAGSAAAALALTQVFGFTVTGIGLAPEAAGATNLATQIHSITNPPAAADLAGRVEQLKRRPGGVPPGAVYVDARPERTVHPIQAAQWFLALTDTWTTGANAVASEIRLGDREQNAASVQQVLTEDPEAVVLVPAEHRQLVVADLPQRGSAARVIGI